MKCNFCGKKIEKENDGLKWRGEMYCTSLCANKEMHAKNEKKQKHEEIKQIALNVFVHNNCCIDSVGAWEEAEKFYEYAKEQEKHDDDNDR